MKKNHVFTKILESGRLIEKWEKETRSFWVIYISKLAGLVYVVNAGQWIRMDSIQIGHFNRVELRARFYILKIVKY